MRTSYTPSRALMLSMIMIALISCTKIKYHDFKINRITLKSDQTVSTENQPNLYIKCEGPGVSNVTNTVWRMNDWDEVQFSANFSGTRGSAEYEFTLREKLNSGDKDLSKITIDMGKYKGQENFTIEGDKITLQFSVDWDAWW